MTEPREPYDERPVYVISVAAELAGMHPQTLRTYDRLGLVSPNRAGRARRYSARDVARLREVARLSHEEGIGLSGIQRILGLQREVAELRDRVRALAEELTTAQEAAHVQVARALATQANATRRDIVPFDAGPGQQVVVWRRHPPS
jgi:MerR family transcriptional regulator/heat shock protein HspR